MNAFLSNPLVIVLGLALFAAIVYWIVANRPRPTTESDPGLGWSVENPRDPAPTPVEEPAPLVFEAAPVAVEPLPTLDAKVDAAIVEVTTAVEPAPEPVVKPKRTAKRAPAPVVEAPAVTPVPEGNLSGTAKSVRKPRATKST
jgi:hypothetical protein